MFIARLTDDLPTGRILDGQGWNYFTADCSSASFSRASLAIL